MKTVVILLSLMCSAPVIVDAQSQHVLEVDGLGFTLDGKPFYYTGVSFFNAIYNPTFNKSDESRKSWLDKLKTNGINVIRVWGQWDNKEADPARLVTNSPGYAGILGSPQENAALDFLSPHTTRRDDLHWEIAPKEVAYLIEKYRKPVVDDEPARRGTPKFGGPKNPTSPYDHVLRIHNVWKTGGHVIYHHDMFQTGYGSDAIPPSGIPDPDFGSYHKIVFDFLADKERYLKNIR